MIPISFSFINFIFILQFLSAEAQKIQQPRFRKDNSMFGVALDTNSAESNIQFRNLHYMSNSNVQWGPIIGGVIGVVVIVLMLEVWRRCRRRRLQDANRQPPWANIVGNNMPNNPNNDDYQNDLYAAGQPYPSGPQTVVVMQQPMSQQPMMIQQGQAAGYYPYSQGGVQVVRGQPVMGYQFVNRT